MTVSAPEIATAVSTWLGSLDDAQRAQAVFPFSTDERFAWGYTPVPRRGLALRDMRPSQRAGAMGILAATMSRRANVEVGAIMALETLLGELERAEGRPGWERREPELYWFAVFGDPASTEGWSWRVNGHHVFVHVTLEGGRVLAGTPSFLGSNPAVVRTGPRAGERVLTGEETLARDLLTALSASERAVAVVSAAAPTDILSGTGRVAATSHIPAGIRHANLGSTGQAALERLVRHYLDRLRPDAAAAAWDRVAGSSLGDVTFAWAGSDQPGSGHYYAVRGQTFLVEYDNTQNGANHIHSVWRELDHDWGDDLLARHLATAHGGTGGPA
jgi:hypothetical protein